MNTNWCRCSEKGAGRVPVQRVRQRLRRPWAAEHDPRQFVRAHRARNDATGAPPRDARRRLHFPQRRPVPPPRSQRAAARARHLRRLFFLSFIFFKFLFFFFMFIFNVFIRLHWFSLISSWFGSFEVDLIELKLILNWLNWFKIHFKLIYLIKIDFKLI